MGNWSDLKQAVAQVIKNNGNQEITGQILQNVLNAIISNVGQHATFGGIATPSTNPGTPDGNVFYIASQAGIYSNFSGISLDGQDVCVFLYNGSIWYARVIGASKVDIKKLNANTGIDEYETFSNAKEYPAGYTLMKDGRLYTFKVDHAAGAWNSEEVEYGSLKKELEKSMLDLSNITNNCFSDITNGTNLLDINRKSYGGKHSYIRGSNGNIVDTPDHQLFITHLIPLKKGQTHITISTSSALSSSIGYRFLDSYGNVVGFGAYENKVSQQTIVISEGAVYAQFTLSENYTNVQIEYGEFATEYKEYIGMSDYALKQDVEKSNNVYLVNVTSTLVTGLTGVSRVGDRYYNTNDKTLYECTEFTSKANFKVKKLPLNKSNIYICKDNIYIYDGTDLVLVREIEIKLSDITSETLYSDKVNVKAVGDIYYNYVSGTMCIVARYVSQSDFSIRAFEPKDYHIFNYNGVLFKYVNGALIQQRDNKKAFITTSKDSIASSDSIYINFPNNIKHGKIYTFTCRFTGNFEIAVMHGTEVYTNGAIKINNTRYNDRNFRTNEWNNSVELGFTAKDFLSVVVKEKEFQEGADVIIISSTGMKKAEIQWNGCQGKIYGYVTSGNITDAKLSVSFSNVYKNTWFFGDSYFDIWLPLLESMTKGNYMVDGHSGRTSAQAYASLLSNLKYHIPQTIVWCMGMNDNDTDDDNPNSSWKEYLDHVMDICKHLGINLILSTIPLVPERFNKAKNNYVTDSGYKYIDVNKAVGADISTEWYNGFCLDRIHPTELGGYAIAAETTTVVKNL